jgi:hypothetical protein
MLEKYLEDLERRIDETVEDTLWLAWKDFTDGRFSGDIFTPRRAKIAPPKVEWPRVKVNETLDNFEMMALQQLRAASELLGTGGGNLLCVRSNYGTGIMPSLFGAEIFVMPEELDTLPTSRTIEGGLDGIRTLIQKGVHDLRAGYGARVLEMAEYFESLFAKYPKVKKYVHHYHPDLQGPMDVCELLWGSNIFVDIYDEPALVHSLLKLVTQTYTQFLKAWAVIVPFEGDYTVHWEMMHKGHILLRNDSAMNFSPAMYEEFIQPYNQQLFDTLGGGADHFCGRGDHFIAASSRTLGLNAITMSQPHLNNMETIFQNTVDKGIKLIGLERTCAESAIQAGRDLHGNVHCN